MAEPLQCTSRFVGAERPGRGKRILLSNAAESQSGNRETNPDPSSKRVSRVRSLGSCFSFVLGAEGCTACHEQGQQGTQCRSDASECLGHFTPPSDGPLLGGDFGGRTTAR
jgi:hypothetical protein